MNPKVSILVPVYNVSEYIEKCATSLFKQTFKDIEFVFVDDASPDNSIEILRQCISRFPERENQVKIVHHSTNKGLACTRNTAIDASTGEYIAVVDSDDYIEPTAIEEIYHFAIKENADLVIFDMVMEYTDKEEVVSDIICNDKNEDLKNLFIGNNSPNLFNKFAKSNLFKMPESRVPNGLNYYEDLHVSIRLYYFATTTRKYNKVLYHYVFTNNGSFTKNLKAVYFENVVRFWELLEAFLKNKKLHEQFNHLFDYLKVSRKLKLMLAIKDFNAKKKYATIFEDEEKRCLHLFNRGERFILWTLRNKHFLLFEVYYKLLLLKNKHTIS